jgi:hypothetical protein
MTRYGWTRATLVGTLALLASAALEPQLLWAQPSTRAARVAQQPLPAKPQPKKPQPSYAKAAVMLNGQPIAPGEVLQVLFGAAGPPDWIQAVRSKEAASDFVLFAYDGYGMRFHIKTVNKQNNIVDLIVITQSNVQVKNVPFRVGDEYRSVTQLWGEPDSQEAGFAAFWRRGVYMGVSEAGRVTSITLAEPGKLDDDPATPTQGSRALPAGRHAQAEAVLLR